MQLTDDKPLTRLYQKRKAKNQDLVIVISDHHNRRGTGKTVLSLKLAEALDDADGLTEEKCSINTDQLIANYTAQPKGSALVLDEAEAGLSKYEAASETNKAVRELVSMGRVEQKRVIMNLPATGELDRDLLALCDVWILVTERGKSVVHFLPFHPYQGETMTPKVQHLRWSDIDDPRLRRIYESLHEEKQEYLNDDERQLHDAEAVEQIREQTELQTRNDLLKDLYETTDLTQEELAESVGLSRSRIADIVG